MMSEVFPKLIIDTKPQIPGSSEVTKQYIKQKMHT